MNRRTYIVGRAEAGRTVADWLRHRLSLPPGDVRRLLRERRVTLGGAPCLDPSRRLQRGQRLEVRGPSIPKKTPPGTDASGSPAVKPVLVYADEHVVVVDKPPGLTTMRHAGGRGRVRRAGAASCRRPWPTCCPACCRSKRRAGRPRRAPSTASTTTPAAWSSSRAPPRRNAISAGSSGAHHRAALSRLGARTGEVGPHRVGAGARPRRRPARQHDRPCRRRPAGRDPCPRRGGTSATSRWWSAD